MSPPIDSPPADLNRLSKAALKSLVVKQWEQLTELQRVVAALRDEIARLKGGPPRPNIKPSGMEQATDPKPPPGTARRPRGDTRSKLSIDEERIVKVASPRCEGQRSVSRKHDAHEVAGLMSYSGSQPIKARDRARTPMCDREDQFPIPIRGPNDSRPRWLAGARARKRRPLGGGP
jgi:hypothetical protein